MLQPANDSQILILSGIKLLGYWWPVIGAAALLLWDDIRQTGKKRS